MENCLATDERDIWRGDGGPLKLERGPRDNPLFRRFFEAVQQAGYPLTDDVNGYRQEGFAAFDRNIYRGRRLSAARAYLHPVMDRPNLEVRTRAFVDRDPVRRDARGRRRGRRTTARTERIDAGEVHPLRRRDQLAAAAPALGRRQRRRAARRSASTSSHDLPAVGENLQDHLEVYVQYACKQPVSVAPAMKLRNRPEGRRGSGCSSGAAPARRTTSRRAASSAPTTTSPTRT